MLRELPESANLGAMIRIRCPTGDSRLRYPIFSGDLLKKLDIVNGYPRLDSGFESSLPGLHFLGAPAAWSFGPLMRFVAGTEFTSRTLVRRCTSVRAWRMQARSCTAQAAN